MEHIKEDVSLSPWMAPGGLAHFQGYCVTHTSISFPALLWQERKRLCASYDSASQPVSIDLFLVGTVGQEALQATEESLVSALTSDSVLARPELRDGLPSFQYLVLLAPLEVGVPWFRAELQRLTHLDTGSFYPV